MRDCFGSNIVSDAPAVPKLLSSAALADLVGVQRQTLRLWRMSGRGPSYFRLGGPSSRALYREEDVLRWIETRPTFTGTCEEKAARRAKAKGRA